MNRTVKYFTLLTGISFLLAANFQIHASDTVDLRGYGQVSAEFAPGQAIFHCADEAHADILLGKLPADLFWDAGSEATQHNLNVENVNITVHAWAPYGELAVGRIGSLVMAFGEKDDNSLLDLLRQHPEFVKGSPVFAAAKPYPRYLDHYDLRAFKAYTSAMGSPRGLGLDSHWPFIKQFGLGGIAFQSLGVWSQNPAPGVVNFVASDYEMRVADQQGGVASIGLTCGGEVPTWIYNQMPDGMMQPSPTSLMGAWNGPGPVGAHFESWWLSDERRASGSLMFTYQAMERYRYNPALSAWHLYTGAPGAELSFHDRAGDFWDYSPTGVAAFRNWLRDVRKYDLATLGQQWYGDTNHYRGWDQVEIPDINGFFGHLDDSCLRLTNGWLWASVRDGVIVPPTADSPNWIPVEMPPSQQQTLLPWGEAFYRIEFDARDWAGRSRVWLSCNTLLRANHATIVWLNGVKLAKFTSDNNPLPFAVSLAGKLKPGRNELILRVPRQSKEEAGADNVREGKIFGPVFLTSTEPMLYPFLGEQANARYVDLREWQAAGVAASHRTMLDMALAIDPDHPFNLSGSADDLTDEATDLAEQYGASCQHTGREAWYHPWWAGIGLVGGFYGTSEESTTANTDQLTRELGWLLLDGDSNHNLFWNIEDYQLEEKKTGWFTKNQRAIQCFGKYLRVMPQVAILRSGRDILLGLREPWNWDLGYGELQAAHFDNAYATETELLKGLTDVCPVLIDDDTEIMDDDVVEALYSYIERGGTFIAFQQTGLHSSIKQNAQPLTRLTELLSTPHANDKLHIVAGAPVLSAWIGHEFNASGVSLSPAPAGFAVPGEAPVAVAKWSDGTMAIAVRQIGKGRVIQLGSSFWRDHLKNESEFLYRLLNDVGVKRNADASDANIWARKAITKNGLQDWLLTYNNSENSRTADVRLAVDQKPAEVWDLLSRKPVAASFDDGFVTIHGVHFEPRAVHLFAVKRADLVDGLPFWWGEKNRYWKRPPAMSSPEVAVAKQELAKLQAQVGADTETIPFNHWKFLADRDGQAGMKTDWLQPSFDDSAWSGINSGPWNLLDPALADWHGTGLYRAAFTVPEAWKGRRVILNLYDFDHPIVYDQGAFFINGTKVADYQAHGWFQTYAYDVTPLLRAGGNILTVRAQGGRDFSGICGSVWLEPEKRFDKEINLAGTWSLVDSDYHTETLVQLPGAPTGRYLKREVELPADWFWKTVFLHLETDNQWLGIVVVNGRLICNNSYMHPFSPRCELNLTPYLMPGKNRIELWPYATTPTVWAKGVKPQLSMSVRVVRLELVNADALR